MKNCTSCLDNCIKIVLILFAILSFLAPYTYAQSKNGFDLSNATVSTKEILFGGPPRDGIPSIDDPRFVSANKANYLRDSDIIIGIVRGETVRAYPIRILVWHEIVNDTVDGDPIVVTYCPLCGTAMVFDRNIGGKTFTFGVSGLLYKSDVLMYDRETESLWSQLEMKAISGTEVGKKLVLLPSEHLTWKAWRERFPDSVVLSADTGYVRDYVGKNPYEHYFASDKTMFPVPHLRKELSNKEWVIGIVINGKAKAYPLKNLTANAIGDEVGGENIVVRYEKQKKYPLVTTLEGKKIPYVKAFWFAWQAFYPHTELWTP